MAAAKTATTVVSEVDEKMNIIQRITAIKAEVGTLEKTQGGGGVPFPFRGIDATVNHLSNALIKYGVVTVPEVVEHMVNSREAGNRVIKTTEVITKFHFYAPDMTFITSVAAGLADDFGDRSTAQAQSVAYRIALLQTFTLPTQSPEPEVTGQTVMDQAATQPKPNAALAKAAAKTVTKAAAADPAVAKIEELRLEVKKAAGAKGLSMSELNELGVAIDPNFFTSPEALTKLVAKLAE